MISLLILGCRYFEHIFTKLISNIMYISIDKQLISFENCFNFLLSPLSGKGLKDVSFQMSPRTICSCELQI